MEPINARTLNYELVELNRKMLLYTSLRIDRQTVPKGYYCYDIRHSDEDGGEVATIEPNVLVNHMGTVISAVPFNFENESYICIDGELNFFGYVMNLIEYMEQFGESGKA